jgi:hypothetical protein
VHERESLIGSIDYQKYYTAVLVECAEPGNYAGIDVFEGDIGEGS